MTELQRNETGVYACRKSLTTSKGNDMTSDLTPSILAEDLLRGATQISTFIGDRNVRSTFWKLENGMLPAFKEGSTWVMRKSTYVKHIEEKEIAGHEQR
jgi:hypothetical protein